MLAIVAFLVVLVRAAPGDSLEIVLKSQAYVDRPTFTIADVADVGPEGHPLRDQVLAISLGPAPRPKAPRTVTTTGLVFALQDHGIDAASVLMPGASECVVQVRQEALKGEDLLSQAKAYLENELKADALTEIESPAVPPDIELPAMREPPVIRFDHGKTAVTGGPVRINITIDVGGQTYSRTSLMFRVRVFTDVYVAASFIPRGASLVNAPIVPARVERALMRGEPLVSLEQLNGLVARRDLREGETLFRDDGVRPIVMRSGEPVTILVTRGPLTVTARGVVRGEGAVGDLVAVQNLDTKRVLKARVDGPGLVSVP